MQVIINGRDASYSEIKEVERHLHSSGSWFGKAATPAGETHVADRVGSNNGAFQIDAGDNTWGAWVQILGSSDTPARSNQLYFDPHEMVITAVERTAAYFIQFARGESAAAALSAGSYTELVLDTTDRAGGNIVRLQTGRAPAGSKLWARCMCPAQNTATIDFYIGIHEYDE